MTRSPTEPPDPTDPLESLRRANRVLRERVAELERQLARVGGEAAAPLRAVLTEREVLLAEAERIAHVGSWMWNLVTGEVSWSDELFRILGLDPATDVASTEAFFERVHPDDRARVRGVSERSVTTGVAEQVDYRVVRPDGELRHVTMDGAVLCDSAGRPCRAVGTVLDETPARDAARALRRTADLLADAQRIANVGSFEADLEHDEHRWSEQLYRIVDVDPATPPSPALFLDRLHPDDRPEIGRLIERSLATGETALHRARVQWRDGSLRHVETAAAAVRDRDGRLVAIRGTISDITERLRLEAQLHQGQKMEAIGLLAGGLAHDFNNLLAVILGNVELAQQARPSPELRAAISATVDARELTSQLLTLGRQSVPHTQTLRLRGALAECEPLLRRAAGDLIVVTFELADSWPVRTQHAQLQQVVLNLVLNARDAMPEGGTVRITTRHDRPSPAQVAGHRATDGDHVVLEVADSGAGMDEETLARAFEPFFTTKPAGRGTGLGLAVVFGAMRQAGGFVEVTSRPREGTRVSLWFPRAGDPGIEAPPSVAPGRPVRVLLVEDEPAVARVTRRILEDGGYHVTSAGDGLAALAVWSEAAAEVLVTDVRMPGMSGVALAERLRSLNPGLPTLFVTGHSAEEIDLSAHGARAVVLMKPYTRQELLTTLARLLDAAA